MEKQDYLTEGEYSLHEFKHIKANAELTLGYAGLFAGFEAFIMNSYVGEPMTDSRVTWAVTWLAVSFLCNIYTAINSLCISYYMKIGYLRNFLMGFLFTSFVAIGLGIISFASSFLLFMQSTLLPDLNSWGLIILFISCSVLIVILILMLIIGFCTDDKKRQMWFSDKIDKLD